MSDMELVIKIPEEEYELCKKYKGHLSDHRMISDAIANGTPLPKGHGRLIDADKVVNDLETLRDSWNSYGNEYVSGMYKGYDSLDEVMDAPTIIGADKTESEE